MTPLFLYLLKANVALMLFYLVYRVWLRRLTFYDLNRFFLLGGIAFSAFYPFLDLSGLLERHAELQTVQYIPDLTYAVAVQSASYFGIWQVLAVVFWTGAGVMLVRLLLQLLSLYRLHRRSESVVLNGTAIRAIRQALHPFSFFKDIYINPSIHNEEELEAILAHERVHVRQWHSLDVLTGEVNNIFYWFNPGAWLMKAAIRENLEFIADRSILRAGMDARTYQYNLLRTAGMSGNALPVASHFNFTHLKNRIVMMNKKRSAGVNLLKYVVLIPVTGVALLVFTAARQHPADSDNISPAGFLQQDTVAPRSPAHVPEDYKTFMEHNPDIKGLFWSDESNGAATVVHIRLKNGTVEKYDLTDPSSVSKAEAKYGKLPAAPPPPPPPPAAPGTPPPPPAAVRGTRHASPHLPATGAVTISGAPLAGAVTPPGTVTLTDDPVLGRKDTPRPKVKYIASGADHPVLAVNGIGSVSVRKDASHRKVKYIASGGDRPALTINGIGSVSVRKDTSRPKVKYATGRGHDSTLLIINDKERPGRDALQKIPGKNIGSVTVVKDAESGVKKVFIYTRDYKSKRDSSVRK